MKSPIESDRTNDVSDFGAAEGVWRIVDAAANRAGEALRVVEDVVRFVLDDARLTSQAKDLRHALAVALDREPLRSRWSLRDVSGDVGIDLVPATSLRRGGVADLIAANAARAAQSLRSLAETVAVVAPSEVAAFERLRYGLYALERGALTAARARERLADIHLCVLLDAGPDERAFCRLFGALVDAGVRLFQVRDKSADVPTLLGRTRSALAIARRSGPDRVVVVVNDRVDVAAALGADGVHVGAEDMPVDLARRVLGPGGLVGRTAHDVAEAREAAAGGADYLGIGPCFPSPTKSFTAHAGPEFLRAVAAEIALPAFAIGGVTLERIAALAALGVHRVAVASAVTRASDPAAAARAFIARLAEIDPSAGS